MIKRLVYDPPKFIFKDLFIVPKYLVKEICLFFSFLNFACVVSESHDKDGQTIYGQNENVFRFGVAVAVLGIWFSVCLFVIDIFFLRVSNPVLMGKLRLFEIYISCVMAFLFFASFLALARGWKNRVPAHPESADYGKHNARASIVFALFSSIAWFFSTIIARIRYQHYNLESSYTGPILKEDHMHITSFPRITELQSSTFDATKTPSSYTPPVF